MRVIQLALSVIRSCSERVILVIRGRSLRVILVIRGCSVAVRVILVIRSRQSVLCVCLLISSLSFSRLFCACHFSYPRSLISSLYASFN